MAVEPRRGCGYRKIGGLYLVSGREGLPCDRLPFPLAICPTCSQGIKQTRGWTWIDPTALFRGGHVPCIDSRPNRCPVCNPSQLKRAGLLWIGGKFYPTTDHFKMEAAELGISRRIRTIPHGFKLGESWILLAHPSAISDFDNDTTRPGIFMTWRPSRIEKILPVSKVVSEERTKLEKRGITCVFVPDNDLDHKGTVYEEADRQLEFAQ